jgi:hypothetical protein
MGVVILERGRTLALARKGGQNARLDHSREVCPCLSDRVADRLDVRWPKGELHLG